MKLPSLVCRDQKVWTLSELVKVCWDTKFGINIGRLSLNPRIFREKKILCFYVVPKTFSKSKKMITT